MLSRISAGPSTTSAAAIGAKVGAEIDATPRGAAAAASTVFVVVIGVAISLQSLLQQVHFAVFQHQKSLPLLLLLLRQ